MANLRVEKKDVYKIEVNDNGDFIEFDLADIGLRSKCYEALDNLEKIAEEYEEKLKDIKSDKDLATMENQMFADMRKAMDVFLGEGACQKIFGDRNYYEMFNDLMDELSKKRPELKNKSHLDMLNMSAEKIRDRIVNKYAKDKKNVI